MASVCGAAIRSGSRSIAARSRTLTAKSIPSPLSFPSSRAIPSYPRVLLALGSVESLMPLHSAIANARLKSSIAVDSSCWSWLSQGFATPL